MPISVHQWGTLLCSRTLGGGNGFHPYLYIYVYILSNVPVKVLSSEVIIASVRVCVRPSALRRVSASLRRRGVWWGSRRFRVANSMALSEIYPISWEVYRLLLPTSPHIVPSYTECPHRMSPSSLLPPSSSLLPPSIKNYYKIPY